MVVLLSLRVTVSRKKPGPQVQHMLPVSNLMKTTVTFSVTEALLCKVLSRRKRSELRP